MSLMSQVGIEFIANNRAGSAFKSFEEDIGRVRSQLSGMASEIDPSLSAIQQRVAAGFKFAGFDTSALEGMKSQFETAGNLQDRLFAATHTNLETALKQHADYFANLRVTWQKNESMLTLINKTETAERAKILKDYETQSTKSTSSIGQSMGKLLALAGIGTGLYGLKRAFTSITEAAMESENAEFRMTAALRLTGDATDSNIRQLKRYAEELKKLTIYGDEEILLQMSMAKSMGTSTRELDRVTVAAMGLAAAYNKDLSEAMRIVTLASQGETGQLKRMGIIIDQNLGPQERYNQLIALGARNFDMAVAATQTAGGSLKQYQNAMHGTKAAIGSALLPAIATYYKTMQVYLEQNQNDLKAWAEGTIGILTTVVNAYLKAQRKFGDLAERAATPALIDRTAWEQYLNRYPEEQKRQEELLRKTREGLSRAPFGAPAYSMPTPRIQPANPDALEDIKRQLRGEQETIWDEREKLQKEIAGRLTTLPGKYELPRMDLSGQEKVWAQSEAENKQIVDRTRDALDAVRHMDYLTRQERITNLEAYRDAHRDVMYDTVGQETEAGQLIREEIEAVKNSRLDAMMLYRKELQEDMESSSLYISERFAEASRSMESSLSNSFQSMIRDGASWRDATIQFLTEVQNAFIKMAADMVARQVAAKFIEPSMSWLAKIGTTLITGGMGGGGGGGGNPAADAQIDYQFGTEAHQGLRVGQPGPGRYVSAKLFENAPKYHDLESGEVAIIAERGEEISRPGRRRGGSAPSVVINNNTGQSFAQDGPPNFDGERWVVGIIAQNIKQGGGLKKMMGR